MRLAEKTIVADKYEIVSAIGAGGMGTVYRARQLTMNRDVALKFLNVLTDDGEAVARFQREARILSTLKHRNLLGCYEFGVWDGHYYVAMEYAPGVSLDGMVEELPNGRMDGRRVVGIAKQVAEALKCAHANGVIHRDLKPSNILLLDEVEQEVSQRRTPDQQLVKVIDFGLAKVVASGNMQKLTETGYAVGSILYMSPEQCTGQKIDERADFYGLGAVMFYALTGRPVFDGDNPILIMQHHMHSPPPNVCEMVPAQEVPFGLDAVIDRCLAKAPAERYQSADELLEALNAVSFDKTATPVVSSGAHKSHSGQLPALLDAIPSGRSWNAGTKRGRSFVVAWAVGLSLLAMGAAFTPVIMSKFFPTPKEDPMAMGYQMISQQHDYQLAAPYFERAIADKELELSPSDRKMALLNIGIAKFERSEKKHSHAAINDAADIKAWVADSTHISPQHAFFGSAHIPMTDMVLVNAMSNYANSSKTYKQVRELAVHMMTGPHWTPVEGQFLRFVYGYTAMEDGTYDEAIATFNALANYKKELPNMTATLAEADAQLAVGQRDKALALYRKVAKAAMKKELVLEAKEKIKGIESGSLKAERHQASMNEATAKWLRYWESLDILHYES